MPNQYPKAGQNPLGRVQWQEVVVMNKTPISPNIDVGETLFSNHLRIIAHGVGGTIVDRITIGSSPRGLFYVAASC